MVLHANTRVTISPPTRNLTRAPPRSSSSSSTFRLSATTHPPGLKEEQVRTNRAMLAGTREPVGADWDEESSPVLKREERPRQIDIRIGKRDPDGLISRLWRLAPLTGARQLRASAGAADCGRLGRPSWNPTARLVNKPHPRASLWTLIKAQETGSPDRGTPIAS